MKENPVRICDTILRDAHQSLLATRMRTDDMLPIAEKLDQVGYWSVEMWGGATAHPQAKGQNAQHALSDAPAGAERGGLQALSRRRAGAVHRQGPREWH